MQRLPASFALTARGPSRCAGFHAALALNGVEMEDRVLTVKRAKAKQAAEGGAAAKKAAPQVAPLPLDASSRVVYVGNLPWEVDEEVLAATFEVRFGAKHRCEAR